MHPYASRDLAEPEPVEGRSCPPVSAPLLRPLVAGILASSFTPVLVSLSHGSTSPEAVVLKERGSFHSQFWRF